MQGDFGREYFPTATELSFKPGAQIMLLNNDRDGRWVNGSIGMIASVQDDETGREYLARAICKTATRRSKSIRINGKFTVLRSPMIKFVSEPVGTFSNIRFASPGR